MATVLTVTFTCDNCGHTEVHQEDPADWWDDPVITPPDGWDHGGRDGDEELCPTCLALLSTDGLEDGTQVDLGGGMVVPLSELMDEGGDHAE